ncbi:LuxR family transcriptional regulator [Streptomyces capparidis]
MRSAKWNTQRAALDELLGGSGRSRGGVLVVHGGPGTGKSSLLCALGNHASTSGALYLAATGFPNEREIPFSVLEQLTHAPGAPGPVLGALARLMYHGASADPPDALDLRALRDLTAALGAAARQTPVVIAVDDLHHADRASRACLLHLARRARTNGIVMVLAHGQALRRSTAHRPELLGLPACRMLETATLPRAETRELVERRLGAEAADRLGGFVHDVSGGSPALVGALVEDLAASGAASGGRPSVGDHMSCAYLAVLVRYPSLLACARALAVLGEHGTPDLVARLLDRDAAEVGRDLRELDGAGLLGDGRFRHPDLAAAVLEAADAAERARLHRRAAALLSEECADAPAVAAHLVAADDTPEPERVAVLLSAATRSLGRGQADEALRFLRLADRADLDAQGRRDVLLALVHALWYVNPAAAAPEAERLLAEMRAGALDRLSLHPLILWLLWFGRGKEADEAIAHLAGVLRPGDPRDAEQLAATRVLVGYFRPASLDLLPADPGSPALGAAATHPDPAPLLPAPTRPEVRRVAAAPPPEPPAPARRLRWKRDAVALLDLLRHGRLVQADRMGEELLARPPERNVPARRAFYTALHGHIRVLRGDLRTGAERAAAALELLPPHNWGVAVGLPLSALVLAATFSGRLQEAARYLERPVPEEMAQSSFGVLYLMARGHHHLATGRPYAALTDFTACGPTVDRREPRYDLIGWRSSVGEAYLALGDPHAARRLAVQELAQLGDRPTVPRGRALRLLAAAGEPDRRAARLEEAAWVLRACGGRLVLARVLAELSQVRLADGDTSEARGLWHEARRLTEECGASSRWITETPVVRAAPPGPEPGAAPVSREAAAAGAAAERFALSEAEWRVAALASAGKSNRQIATQLYITVSTVEQHLTRVYRKLSIQRRADLPRILGPVPSPYHPEPDASLG